MTNGQRLLRIAARQNDRCCFCHLLMIPCTGIHPLTPDTMTREHVIPVAYGGQDHDSNYLASCHRCNSLRGTLHFDLFAKIVQGLFTDDGFQEHWHTTDEFIVRLLRKAVGLEVMRAYAYVSRVTAFEYLQKREWYILQAGA